MGETSSSKEGGASSRSEADLAEHIKKLSELLPSDLVKNSSGQEVSSDTLEIHSNIRDGDEWRFTWVFLFYSFRTSSRSWNEPQLSSRIQRRNPTQLPRAVTSVVTMTGVSVIVNSSCDVIATCCKHVFVVVESCEDMKKIDSVLDALPSKGMFLWPGLAAFSVFIVKTSTGLFKQWSY